MQNERIVTMPTERVQHPTSTDANSSLTLKMKHDSLKARPPASKNKTLTVGIKHNCLFLTLGYSSIKVDFFFANRGSCAHACIDTYGNDVLIHILSIC